MERGVGDMGGLCGLGVGVRIFPWERVFIDETLFPKNEGFLCLKKVSFTTLARSQLTHMLPYNVVMNVT
jgi:hypothetical protein